MTAVLTVRDADPEIDIAEMIKAIASPFFQTISWSEIETVGGSRFKCGEGLGCVDKLDGKVRCLERREAGLQPQSYQRLRSASDRLSMHTRRCRD